MGVAIVLPVRHLQLKPIHDAAVAVYTAQLHILL
jgi:hypothetical protein